MAKRSMMRGYLCSGGGAIIWGMSGTAGQYLLSRYGVDPFWLTSIRMVCAGLVLTLVAGREYKTMLNILKNKKDCISMLGYSLMGLLLSQVSFLKCIQYSNAGTAGILQTLSVVMMAVIVCLRTRRLPDFREGLSIVLALVGVVLIATHGDLSRMALSPEGLQWGLAAAVATVCYSFLAQNLVWKWGSVPVNALSLLVGGTLFSLFIQPWNTPSVLDTAGYIIFAAIILIGTDLTFILFLRGVGDIGPIKATLIGTLEPVSASVVSALVLGTVFYIPELIGCVCVLMTVFLVMARQHVGG